MPSTMSCDGADDRVAVDAGRRCCACDSISDLRLGLRLDRQRQVHGHLVAVEVGVEAFAHQRVNLDRVAFDEHRLERLDAHAVQRRGAVQQHRVAAR